MAPNVAKNTLYLTAASIGQKVISFFYFLAVARFMEVELTGAYFLALSITTMFSVIADFGVTPVVIREVAKRPGEATALVRRALGVKIPFMALGAISAIIATRALGYGTIVDELVLVATFVMLADAISLLYYGVLRGSHALKFESIGIFVGQACTTIIGAIVLLVAPSLHLLIFALLVGSTFNMFFSAWQVARRYGTRILVPTFDAKAAKTLLVIALPFALAGIFVKVYSYVDSLFISKMVGTAAVGVYSVAYKFTYAFQFLPMALTAALYPGMSALVGRDSKRLNELFRDAMWYVMLIAAPICFGISAVAADMVSLTGESYKDAVPVLGALIFVLIPIFLDFPVGSLLNAADRQGTKTAIMGVTMIINVIANALLIPLFGVIGAAYAALISFWFLWIAGMWFVPKIIPEFRYGALVKTLLPILVAGAAMGLFAHVVRPFLGFFITVAASGVLYALLLVMTRGVTKTHLQHALALIRPKRSYEEIPADHD